MPFLDTDKVPYAARVVVAMCADERCGKLHVVLLDANEVPIAVGALDSLEEHIEDLKRVAYRAAVLRLDI